MCGPTFAKMVSCINCLFRYCKSATTVGSSSTSVPEIKRPIPCCRMFVDVEDSPVTHGDLEITCHTGLGNASVLAEAYCEDKLVAHDVYEVHGGPAPVVASCEIGWFTGIVPSKCTFHS